MPVERTLRPRSWIFAVMLLSLIGGPFADQAFAQTYDEQLEVPALSGFAGRFQVIQSVIGDFDCFGYGVPSQPLFGNSPCGTLTGPPIQEQEDDPQTDLLLDCSSPMTITLTHSFAMPEGATILGALWSMNIGGIERTKFSTTITLDNIIPVSAPQTGALGTTVVSVPIFGLIAAGLYDGEFVVKITRGIGSRYCDDIFVDFSQLTILVQIPPAL